MKKVFFYFLAILIGLSSSTIAFAQGPIINIPDANFKAFLLADSFINPNLDTEIDSTEAASYNSNIFAPSLGINDITGIEAFTSIQALVVADNNLTSVDLSANLSITSLSLGDNSLTTLDVSNNINLTYLECSNNMLASVDVSNNANLVNLFLDNNQLTSLDISSCINLTGLSVYSNLLTDLDLTSNIWLTNVSCDTNQLTTLNTGPLYSLQYLTCSDNLLTCLNMGSNFQLTTLNCSSNPLLAKLNLRNFNNGAITSIDANNCPSLGCVQVDDSSYSATNWIGWCDSGSYYSN